MENTPNNAPQTDALKVKPRWRLIWLTLLIVATAFCAWLFLPRQENQNVVVLYTGKKEASIYSKGFGGESMEDTFIVHNRESQKISVAHLELQLLIDGKWQSDRKTAMVFLPVLVTSEIPGGGDHNGIVHWRNRPSGIESARICFSYQRPMRSHQLFLLWIREAWQKETLHPWRGIGGIYAGRPTTVMSDEWKP